MRFSPLEHIGAKVDIMALGESRPTMHRDPNNPEHASIFFLVLLFRRPVSPVYDLTAAYGDISVPEMNNRRFFFALRAFDGRHVTDLHEVPAS